MSTRGTWGFVVNGDEKLTYNHFDSYPDGLGTALLAYLRQVVEVDGLDVLRDEVRNLVLVNEDVPPTPEIQERLRPLADTRVGSGNIDDWYVLLRATQGDPRLTLQAGFMVEGRQFANDSLFCEWGYVIDLDNNVLEVYEGFQDEPHEEGRFASPDSDRGYFPIKLVASFSLDDLPSDSDFCAIGAPEEDED